MESSKHVFSGSLSGLRCQDFPLSRMKLICQKVVPAYYAEILFVNIFSRENSNLNLFLKSNGLFLRPYLLGLADRRDSEKCIESAPADEAGHERNDPDEEPQLILEEIEAGQKYTSDGYPHASVQASFIHLAHRMGKVRI